MFYGAGQVDTVGGKRVLPIPRTHRTYVFVKERNVVEPVDVGIHVSQQRHGDNDVYKGYQNAYQGNVPVHLVKITINGN